MLHPPKIRLSGVVLAGGESRRMGIDKAGIEIGGVPLWKCQLDLLQSLALDEYLISGRPTGPYAGAGVPIITDRAPGCGPLGGIVAALEESTQDGILVLAVDTPFVLADFLAGLLEFANAARRSVIPLNRDAYEPLVAIYLKDAHPVASELLRAGDFKLQHFARTLIARNLAVSQPVAPRQQGYFRNLNTPEDLAGR